MDKAIVIKTVARHFLNSFRYRIISTAFAREMASFVGDKDNFGGVIVRSKEEPHERNTMEQLLKESLQIWTRDGVRGVWFEVEPTFSEWIPVLIQHGFSFHHANKELSVLLKWLPVNEPCQIPEFAHTTIGVGSMVVNDNNEILVVQEKYIKEPHWKLPGGFVDPGENLHTAAKREVFEETGIKTEFVSLVAFRHYQPKGKNPRGKFGCSDIYFVSYLRPVGGTEIKMCTRELRNACWMPLKEFVTHPLAYPVDKVYTTQLLAVVDRDNPSLPIGVLDSVLQSNLDNHQIYVVGKQKFDF